MWIYLIVFTISVILIYISENKLKNDLAKKVVICVGLILPCLLAGLRAETIGTDVLVYVKKLFNCAKYASSFSEYLNLKCTPVRYVKDFELFFSSLVYIITKIFGNLQCILFAIHVLIVLPFYFGLKKIKDIHGYLWFGMLIFYLMFFNTSLNAMRQYISISIVFYASCNLLSEHKQIKFLFLVGIASLFHNSAILGITILFIWKILNEEKSRYLKISNKIIYIKDIAYLIIIVLGIYVTFNAKIITVVLNDSGLDYYSRYVDGNINFSIMQVIKVLPLILIFMTAGKSFKNQKNSRFYTVIFIINMLMTQFSTINIYAIRIAYLFSAFNIISIPLICKSNDKISKKKSILILYFVMYWYYNFVLAGYSETVPYSFF